MKTLAEYEFLLLASGLPEREQARALLYAERYGMSAVSGDDQGGCVVFDRPKCGNWNCLNPEHQKMRAT